MDRYATVMRRVVTTTAGLRLRQDDVVGLHVEDTTAGRRAAGVVTRTGEVLRARAVVLTTGTFLGGLLHRGDDRFPGGRAGESPAAGLSASLRAHGLTLGRLKTGTCPRLDARTIRMSDLEEQRPDEPAPRFSFASSPVPPLPQVSCRITRTTTATHKVIQDAVAAGRSPLFNGSIEGRGPRYCPSLEDKVVRFADKESHQIFLEPHGIDTFEVYPNGLSTSLPPDVQLAFLRTIPGLQDVEVTRWGYAVEYDFVDPVQLSPALMTRAIPGLFCAGQLNGTTGYEEAAVQGLLVGLNAVAWLRQERPIVLRRDQAYAGVLVDDLVTRGTDEPYRMFTSRAEHRLVLREDNVAARLLVESERIGLATAARRERMQRFEDAVVRGLASLRAARVPATATTNALLQAAGTTSLSETTTAYQLLKRPQLSVPLVRAIVEAVGGHVDVDDDVSVRVTVEARYDGVLERARADVERERALVDEELPDAIFSRLAAPERMPGISNEVKEKLLRLRPRTLLQASRISGVTPAAVGLLAIEARRVRTPARGGS
jgi:tRNA uridine 5-carboxymethylaminomethyl modification enzyme